MQLKIQNIHDIAKDVKEFTLVHSEGAELPAFTPGAHIEITLKGYQKNYIRRYSLTSSPDDLAQYRIAVLRVPVSAGGSQFLHERASEGDVIDAAEPYNAFPVNDEAPRHLLIAGGIGITPFVPMIRSLSAGDVPFELHYAARSADRFAYQESLKDLAGERVFFYTDDENGRPGMDLDDLLEKQPAGTHIYVVGPRPMIEAVKKIAEAKGFPPAQVHYESFGASVKPEDKPVTLKLAGSNKELHVEPGQTLLDAMLEEGIEAPYGCKRGECGKCALEIVSGEPDARDVCLSEDKRKTHICTCISWAKSNSLTLKF